MSILRSQFVSVIRHLAVVALVLWLGGAGCLLGCEASVSAATGDESRASAEAAESCPSSAGHDCCHHAKDGGDAAPFGTVMPSPGEMSCCPLAGHSTVAAGKPAISDAPAAALGAHELLPAQRGGTRVASSEGGLRVPDRGGTYLRCCVFLI